MHHYSDLTFRIIKVNFYRGELTDLGGGSYILHMPGGGAPKFQLFQPILVYERVFFVFANAGIANTGPPLSVSNMSALSLR